MVSKTRGTHANPHISLLLRLIPTSLRVLAVGAVSACWPSAQSVSSGLGSSLARSSPRRSRLACLVGACASSCSPCVHIVMLACPSMLCRSRSLVVSARALCCTRISVPRAVLLALPSLDSIGPGPLWLKPPSASTPSFFSPSSRCSPSGDPGRRSLGFPSCSSSSPPRRKGHAC